MPHTRDHYSVPSSVSASHLQAVMNTVLDGLIIIDNKGLIQSFNPAAQQIFGYTDKEVIGRNVRILMPEPYHSQHDSYISNYQESKKPKVIGIGREVTGKRKNGTTFPMELGVNEMNVDGLSLFVGMVRDITERKHLEETQAELIQKLATSNAELERFAHICSHDLKEPLRGMHFQASTILEDHAQELTEDCIKKLERITQLSTRMQNQISDLLCFARITTQEIAKENVDINVIIEEIREELQEALNERNGHIIIKTPLPKIICYRVHAKSIFINLITNALKYCDEDKKIIEISHSHAETHNDTTYKNVFCVKDNGIGIDEEFHNDVFSIFRRLNSEKAYGDGTGAGLTFVKKMVEHHDGAIWIKSEKNKGSHFYFTLEKAR